MEKNGVRNPKSLHSSIGRAGNSKLLFVIGSNPIGDINMINEHDFDRNNICKHCGLTIRETRRLRSHFCGMSDCTKEEYEEVQIDRLIHPLRDLGDKYVVAR